ncbi:MAG: hypothetical protein K0S32_2852 [Bacteroidetes bacterium]|jgi:hypothetical protein|nr:hypothetical protein [Bacteroidota bacterium]
MIGLSNKILKSTVERLHYDLRDKKLSRLDNKKI